MSFKHFENKGALSHVVEKRVEGILSLSETHGTEMPGHLSAATDALRETAFFLLLLWMLGLPSLILPFGLGFIAWKTGRATWLGWTRVERLHRVMEQEKYEIETNREQEREELKELYQAKGFEGELLEDVMDVLMADNDRLLKVMLEEELGLRLQAYEHPLKQGFGAFVGATVALAITLPTYALPGGIYFSSLLLIGGGGALSALFEKNGWVKAVVWNVAIATLAITLARAFAP